MATIKVNHSETLFIESGYNTGKKTTSIAVSVNQNRILSEVITGIESCPYSYIFILKFSARVVTYIFSNEEEVSEWIEELKEVRNFDDFDMIYTNSKYTITRKGSELWITE